MRNTPGREIAREMAHAAKVRVPCRSCGESKPNDGRMWCATCWHAAPEIHADGARDDTAAVQAMISGKAVRGPNEIAEFSAVMEAARESAAELHRLADIMDALQHSRDCNSARAVANSLETRLSNISAAVEVRDRVIVDRAAPAVFSAGVECGERRTTAALAMIYGLAEPEEPEDPC